MSVRSEYSLWVMRNTNDTVLAEMVAERACRTCYIPACWEILGSRKEGFLGKISHSQVRYIVKINNNL